ncbi:MAG: cell division protein FtsB [Gammaproteobacteria bacterium]
MRLILILLIVLVLLLQYKLWSSDGGIAEIWHLQRAIEAQQKEIATLKERNAALQAEVEDLRQGVAAIEERARSELGLIKEGETFYQAIDENEQKK